MSSGKFTGEHRCAKESHSEPASSWCLGCLNVPFDVLITLLTSAELMLMLHSVIHWFQNRFLTWVHGLIYYLYVVCTCSRLAGDVCLLYSFGFVLYMCLAILIPMLFSQYGFVDVFFLITWVYIILWPFVLHIFFRRRLIEINKRTVYDSRK